jgi:hypothetical protein
MCHCCRRKAVTVAYWPVCACMHACWYSGTWACACT